MGGTSLNWELFHSLICTSFANPTTFSREVDQNIARNRAINSKTRREFTELLFDVVRWRRRIWGDIAPSQFHETKVVGAVQEAKALRAQPPLAQWSRLSMDALAREVSFPTWIIERWVAAYGFESTVLLALSLNDSAPVTLRTNTLKSDRSTLKAKLAKEDVPTEEGKHSPWALHLLNRANVRGLQAFRDGKFEVQDEGSQLAVQMTDAQPGNIVIDACARTGGKALAFAAMMQNKGKVICTDADARPLDELKKRAKRAGTTMVEPAWVATDDPNPLHTLNEKADIVFVDAPCSGLGTLRRKPMTKWILSPQVVEKRAQTQLTLLQRYTKWVKPGGKLFYVVCTLLPDENKNVTDRFLAETTNFTAGEIKTLRPDTHGTDGFFIATFSRTL